MLIIQATTTCTPGNHTPQMHTETSVNAQMLVLQATCKHTCGLHMPDKYPEMPVKMPTIMLHEACVHTPGNHTPANQPSPIPLSNRKYTPYQALEISSRMCENWTPSTNGACR